MMKAIASMNQRLYSSSTSGRRSEIRLSILRKSLRRPFSGRSRRWRTTIAISRTRWSCSRVQFLRRRVALEARRSSRIKVAFQSLARKPVRSCAIRDAILAIPVAGAEPAKSPCFSCSFLLFMPSHRPVALGDITGARVRGSSFRTISILPSRCSISGRTGLDPIAAVVVGNVAEFADGRRCGCVRKELPSTR